MSRRPNPAADRAEQNRATLKNLVKLEGNKTCADCKRNKRKILSYFDILVSLLTDTKIHDGHLGIWASSSVSAAQAFTAAWAFTSVKSNQSTLTRGPTNSYKVYSSGGMPGRTNTGNRSWPLATYRPKPRLRTSSAPSMNQSAG